QSLAEDLPRLSRHRNDSSGLILGHYASSRNLLHTGRFAQSRVHLEEVLSTYDAISPDSLLDQAGAHLQVTSRDLLAIVFFVSVFPTRHWRRAARPLLRLGDWFIQPHWLRAWYMAPGCFILSETIQPWSNMQTKWLRWRPSRVSPTGMPRGHSSEAGSK